MNLDRLALLSIWILGMGSCLAQPRIEEKLVTFGHQKSSDSRTIDVVIIHSTFNVSGGESYSIDGVLGQFKQYGVSAHYLIARDARIYRLVNENDVAYHAGVSELPDKRTKVNQCSLGIEVMTSYTEAPTGEQLQALDSLVHDIKGRYDIKYILRHSDICPGRKTDPWNFDWEGFLARIDHEN